MLLGRFLSVVMKVKSPILINVNQELTKVIMTIEYSDTELEMINLLDQHVNAELQGDLDLTMATMTDNPHL